MARLLRHQASDRARGRGEPGFLPFPRANRFRRRTDRQEPTARLLADLSLPPRRGSAHTITTMNQKLFLIGDVPGFTPQIGRLVSMMNYARHTTLSDVDGMTVEQLDYLHDSESNSIGALLLHLAAVDVWYQAATFESRDLGAEEMREWGAGLDLGAKARREIRGHDLDYYRTTLAADSREDSRRARRGGTTRGSRNSRRSGKGSRRTTTSSGFTSSRTSSTTAGRSAGYASARPSRRARGFAAADRSRHMTTSDEDIDAAAFRDAIAAADPVGRLPAARVRSLRARLESSRDGVPPSMTFRDLDRLLGPFEALPPGVQSSLVQEVEEDERWRLRGYELGDWHRGAVRLLRSRRYRRLAGSFSYPSVVLLRDGPRSALYALYGAAARWKGRHASRPSAGSVLRAAGLDPRSLVVYYARGLAQPAGVSGLLARPDTQRHRRIHTRSRSGPDGRRVLVPREQPESRDPAGPVRPLREGRSLRGEPLPFRAGRGISPPRRRAAEQPDSRSDHGRALREGVREPENPAHASRRCVHAPIAL